MDTENIILPEEDGTPGKVATRSATLVKRMSMSPRKRAFRELNSTDNEVEAEGESPKWRQREEGDTENQRIKRIKLERTQDVYPEPFAAHVMWSLDPECDGTAMLLEDNHCYIGTCGTKDRRVIKCDLDGKVLEQMKLKWPVGELFRHEGRLYAWCRTWKGFDGHKGWLVDMSFETPQSMFLLKDFGNIVTHATMVDGCLVLGDNNKGSVGVFGCDGIPVWKREEQPPLGHGNFFSADESGLYYAHKKVVRSYNILSGDIQWEYVCSTGWGGSISGGYEDGNFIYIESRGRVIQLEKSTGKFCKEYIPYRHKAEGIFAGNGKLVTANNPTIIFDQATEKETHRMFIPARVDKSLAQFSPDGRLYMLWDRLYCINLTDNGLAAASNGTYARTYSRKVPPLTSAVVISDVTHDTHPWLGTLTKPKGGDVIVTCTNPKTRDEDIKTYVKSDGYEADWPVFLPSEFKKAGQQYIVDKLVPSKLGKFYRVTGSIAKYVPEKRAPLAEEDSSADDMEQW